MKKEILISVYNMEIGGIERSLINMLEAFDYDHYHVDLLVFEHSGELMSLIPKQVRVLPQINQYSVFRKPIIRCIKEGYFATSFMRIISKYMAHLISKSGKLREGSGYIQMQLAQLYSMPFLPKIKKQYDVAISYAWPHDILAKKVNAGKKIAWIHTDYSQLEVDKKIDLKVWNRFDHIGSVSEDCTQSFLSQYPSLTNKVFIMENITSPHFIKEMAEEGILEKVSKADFKIVSVGRLSYAKGYDIAIRALKLLHNKGYRNIKWYVVGYGTEERYLKNLIVENNLKGHFILLGKKLNPFPYIKNADLYVQPSRYEGKAVTITEAKILGKPILLTNYPTAKSQVRHGIDGYITGLSVEDVANGIERLIKNPSMREFVSNNCNNEDFSNENQLERLYQVIN